MDLMTGVLEVTQGNYKVVILLPGVSPTYDLSSRRAWRAKKVLDPGRPDLLLGVVTTCQSREKAVYKAMRLSRKPGFVRDTYKFFTVGQMRVI